MGVVYLVGLGLVIMLGSTNAQCWRKMLYPCADGKGCVEQAFVCNGRNDCLDGSDEGNCNKTKCNSYIHKYLRQDPDPDLLGAWLTKRDVCDDKTKCVPKKNVCDGTSNCADGSDEGNCRNRCHEDYVSCDDGLKCVLKDRVCNGWNDCTDGSDEHTCTQERCGSKRFPCADGTQCIPNDNACDGNALPSQTCNDGSDEANCPALCDSIPGKMMCADQKTCIMDYNWCDGRAHCADGSDEGNCDSEVCGKMTPYRIACDDKSKCVLPLTQVCNGSPDCEDSSDEINCSSYRCGPEAYACSSGTKCIWKPKVCDGKNDCPDGDDETDCDYEKCRQNMGYRHTWMRVHDFHFCANSTRCMFRIFKCNGIVDRHQCPAGSDEEFCEGYDLSKHSTG